MHALAHRLRHGGFRHGGFRHGGFRPPPFMHGIPPPPPPPFMHGGPPLPGGPPRRIPPFILKKILRKLMHGHGGPHGHRGPHGPHGPPPLLRRAPPPFMHPIHLEIMLLKKPKLLRKLQQAKLRAISAHQDYDYGDLLGDYYYELEKEGDINAYDDEEYGDYEDEEYEDEEYSDMYDDSEYDDYETDDYSDYEYGDEYDEMIDKLYDELYADSDEENTNIIDDENGNYYFSEDESEINNQKAFEAAVDYNNYEDDYEDDYEDNEYYYESDDISEEEDEEESELTLQDRWVDESDGASWMVSNKVIDDYDEFWDDSSAWDEINTQIVTLHGNQITRKCMRMWGHRLCLCQFLNWIDSRKYKCLPTGIGGYGGSGSTITGGGNIGILPNNGLHATGTYSTYHTYGSPDITHHVTLMHDPDKVKYETLHLIPNNKKNTKITHEIKYKMSSKIKHGHGHHKANEDYDDLYDDDEYGQDEQMSAAQYEDDNYYDDEYDDNYDDIDSDYDNEYKENNYFDADSEYDDADNEYENLYDDDSEYDEEISAAQYNDENEYDNLYDDISDEYEENNYFDADSEYDNEYDNEYNDEYDQDEEMSAAQYEEDNYYDDEYDNEYEDNNYEDNEYDNNEYEENNYFDANNEYDNEYDNEYYAENEEISAGEYEEDDYYNNDNAVIEEANYGYDEYEEDNSDYNYDSDYNNDNINVNSEEEYYYEEEDNNDEQFGKYFNGNNNIEEQNGDMEPDIFWTMNVFGILCGVVFTFFAIMYCIRKRKQKYSFMRLENKTTDMEDSATEYSQIQNNNKYGFHPVNISVNQKFSDDDDDEQNEQQLDIRNHENEESSANDEYANGSDQDLIDNEYK